MSTKLKFKKVSKEEFLEAKSFEEYITPLMTMLEQRSSELERNFIISPKFKLIKGGE